MRSFDFGSVELEGSNIIEASAGTGKTYSIAGIFLRLVLERDMPVDRILVVTFTDAATSELRDRIRQRLADSRSAFAFDSYDALPEQLQNDYIKSCFETKDGAWREEAARRAGRAVTCFDESAISTIHSFCQRVLRENAFEYGSLFNAELVADQGSIVDEILGDFIRTRLYSADPSVIDDVKDIFLGESLRAAIRQAMPKPLAKIESGKPVHMKDLPKAKKSVPAAYAAAEKIWRASRSAIEELLSTSETFDKRFRSSAPKYCSDIDDFFAAGDIRGTLSTGCGYLGAGYLEGKQKKGTPVSHPFFCAWQKYLDARESWENILGGFEATLCAEFIGFAAAELVKRKSERNIWSFDDLLSRVYSGLSGEDGMKIAESVRRKFSAALIDEFQDTDSMQCRIFDSIFNTGDSLLFYIGDPKQAIYSFRGADIHAYEKAREGVEHRFSLDMNRRSSKGVIGAVNALFLGKDPFLSGGKIGFPEASTDKTGLSMTICGEDAAHCVVWNLPGKNETTPVSKGDARTLIASAVAEEISRILSLSDQGRALIEDRPVRPGDIAVLVEMNFHSDIVRREFSVRGIPSVLNDTRNIYESEECLDLERFLMAVCDHALIPASLVSPLIGIAPQQLASMMADDAVWNGVLSCFSSYAKQWDEEGFMRMFREFLGGPSFLGGRAVLDARVTRPGGVRAVTNILHCAECIHRAASEKGLARQGVLQWLSTVRQDPSLGLEPELRLETDEDAVQIVTVHKSKGLEYPVVFVPFSWDSPGVSKNSPMSYHDDEGAQVVDCTSSGDESYDGRFARAEYERLGEQSRLLYVAMTRAKYRCYLAIGRIGRKGYREGYPASAAAWLLHGADVELSPETGIAPLAEKAGALSTEEIARDILSRFAERAPGSRIEPLPEGRSVWTGSTAATSASGSAKIFSRQLRDDWKISSFSYITAGSARSFESRLDETHDVMSVSSGGFPAGAEAGSCLHEILEKISFSADDGTLRACAAESLERWNIDAAHLDDACALVRGTLSAPLGAGTDIVLSKLGDGSVLKEFEFYFPAAMIDPDGIKRIFAKFRSLFPRGEADSLASLSFHEFSGFLKGFIDCLFEYEGRYYVIDWKSNRLGDSHESYGAESLGRAMDHHRYTLQGCIYALAVHEYLATRIPGYSFDAVFGGVFYLFMRGVSPERPGSGIWHFRPTEDFMNELSAFFIRRAEVTQ